MEDNTLKTGLGVGKIRYQTKRITIVAATLTTTIGEALVTLDNAYDRCIGICLQGVAAFTEVVAFGLIGQNDTIIDLVNKDLFSPTTAVAMSSRFMPVNIPAKGTQYTIKNQPLVAIGGADCVFDVVFMLIKDPKE